MQCSCALFSSVACPSVPDFSTLSHKLHAFRKKSLLIYSVCFNFVYNFRLKHFSFEEEISQILSNMYTGLQVKYPLFLSDINKTRVVSRYFRKMLRYPNSIKIHPVGPEMFHAEGQMDGQRDRQKDRNNEANSRFS
jgi:hypothetical protein